MDHRRPKIAKKHAPKLKYDLAMHKKMGHVTLHLSKKKKDGRCLQDILHICCRLFYTMPFIMSFIYHFQKFQEFQIINQIKI